MALPVPHAWPVYSIYCFKANCPQVFVSRLMAQAAIEQWAQRPADSGWTITEDRQTYCPEHSTEES
jgi:hypothetical protein